MVPLFSKVDVNKLWHDFQNEETFICAKFDKDLFNIFEVTYRPNKSGPVFWTHSVQARLQCSMCPVHRHSSQHSQDYDATH